MTAPDGRPFPLARTIRPEQWEQLAGLGRLARVDVPVREACGWLVERATSILQAKAAMAAKDGDRWTVLAESPAIPHFPTTADAWRTVEQVASSPSGIDVFIDEGVGWTLIRLPGEPLRVLALHGDWLASAERLQKLMARTPIRSGARALRRNPAVIAHRLANALGRVSGVPDVCHTVLKYAVRAVPSRLGAVAVPAQGSELMIAATYGYPIEIVEDVRIPIGSGVIGSVYDTRQPMWVQDVAVLGHGRRRPRYRTNSFLAVPITAGADVLGVVCLTDRVDGGAYTRADVSKVRVVVAPAALALGRERQRAEAEHYAQAAIVDPLSGLFNRRYFQERLVAELQRAQRQQTPVALLLVDIDGFKYINDRFGHSAGDAVIMDVADIIRRSVRMFDVCSRFGGEEFAVLMPGTARESARNIAERIRERIALYRPRERALQGALVTASIGLAVADGLSPRELIDAADAALYAAKRAGKNRVAG